jgi:FkbM family methyltransferase
LSRIHEIVSNPRRWPEICWRLFFLSFQQKSIACKVKSAYCDSNGKEAGTLKHYAKVAWGLSPGNVSRARGYIHAAYKSQARLAKEKSSLGTAYIGFDDLRIEARATDANSSRAYLAGFDEGLMVFDIYRKTILPGTVAVDIGANIGIHSLVIARCVGRNGQVYAYEPSRVICERFRENMSLNDVENVTLREVGVGAAANELHFQAFSKEFNIGLGKFAQNGSTKVQVVTLDSDLRVSEPVSLIKIDVEGMELDVIRGAKRTLATHRPMLVMEYNTNWTLDELRKELPYPVMIEKIPVTKLDKLVSLNRAKRTIESSNILVKPITNPK